MPPKPVRTECDVDDDPRLLAALNAIVEHSAAQVGVPEDRAKKLIETARQCCQDAWASNQNHDHHMRVICEQFDDRVEIRLKKPSGEKFCEDASFSKDSDNPVRVSPGIKDGEFTLTLTEFSVSSPASKQTEQTQKRSGA